MTNITTAAGSVRKPMFHWFAHIISYIFHPLFISAYVMGFLIFLHPYAFSGFEHKIKVLRFLHIVLFNALFPAFAVFLSEVSAKFSVGG